MLQDEGGGGGGGWDGFRNVGLNAIFLLILFLMFDDSHNIRGNITMWFSRTFGSRSQAQQQRQAPRARAAPQQAPAVVWRTNDDGDDGM